MNESDKPTPDRAAGPPPEAPPAAGPDWAPWLSSPTGRPQVVGVPGPDTGPAGEAAAVPPAPPAPAAGHEDLAGLQAALKLKVATTGLQAALRLASAPEPAPVAAAEPTPAVPAGEPSASPPAAPPGEPAAPAPAAPPEEPAASPPAAPPAAPPGEPVASAPAAASGATASREAEPPAPAAAGPLRFKARVLRDPLLGCELHGRYRIDRKLGQGGMGAVYQAHQLSVRRDVAVKIMRGEGGIDPTLVKRFFQEARAASQLTSRHTIKIIDFGETDDGIYYMAMELLKGQPLDAVLAEGPMDPERAIQIGRHVCLALKEAHGLGIIHRDLKPSNIFLEPSEEEPEIAKVLDFGIAKWQQAGVSQLTTVGSLYGTPSYMSPEQCQALPLDARSDLYALGVILYQLVAGRPPFDAPSSVLLVMAQVEDPPPPLAEVAPTVPSALARLIHRLLAKQPADRPGSAEELLAELDRVREALRARRPPSRPPLSLSLTAPASLSELQVTDRGGSGPAAIPSAALSGGEPAVRRRWPWVLLPALLIAGLGTGLAVWGSQRPSFLPPPPAPLAELFGSALAPAAPTPAAAPTPGSAGTSSAPASATPPPAGPGVAEAPDAAATPAPVGAEGPQPVGSPTVQIRLLSEPLGAFAIVGDVSVLETPARLKLLIADKPVQVRFRKPGYQDEVRTFTPDQDREVRVVLKAEKP